RPLVYALSCAPPILAAVIAARAEASSARATWGKRREGLTVHDALAVTVGQRIPFKRALVRNLVKISLPWQLGHTVAFGAAEGGFEKLDPVTIGAAAALYPLLGVMLWTALRGDGRAVHDRVAATQVRGSAARDQDAPHERRVPVETESA
ncbi:MAG TPA: RDD family protein, partial [Intrasporangium sp.]|nr:RDD family protein [Intrasporangium sp.]